MDGLQTISDEVATALSRHKGSLGLHGITTLSEAVYLGKPVYSVPVRHQFEQEMNGRYLEFLGYGVVREAVDATSLERFLADIPRMSARVAKHKQEGNSLLLDKLEVVLERLVRKHKKKRAERA